MSLTYTHNQEIQDIIADEFLTDLEIKDIWDEVIGGSKSGGGTCDFDQFLEINELIDEAV